jgi:hypothetical protein
METPDLERSKSWRQRLPVRLAIRALLVAGLLLVVLLGWAVFRGGVQHAAVVTIRKAGGMVHYDWEVTRIPGPDGEESISNPGGQPRWPRALVGFIGPDFFGDVVAVDFQRNGDQYLRERLERQQNEPSEDLIQRQRAADLAMAAAASQLSKLEHLSIAFSPPSNVGLDQLRVLKGLERLRLAHLDGATGEAYKPIEGLKRLRALELEALPPTDAELSFLQHLKELRTLELEQVKLTDAGMAYLEGLVHLRTLTLDSVAITSAGLDHLRDMAHLSALKIRKTGVQDLSAIRHLTGLRELYIMRSPIGDDGLAPVAELAALETLDLSHTDVTDASLSRLQQLPHLSHLDLKKTRLTAEAVARFRAARPQVAVEY